jgi:cysteine-rich repeat protein
MCVVCACFEEPAPVGPSGTESATQTESGATESGSDTESDSDGSETADATSGSPACGNGVVDVGEECDLGEANADDAACKSNCTNATCGDGDLGPGEACDDGNDIDGDGCDACVLTSCGDAELHDGDPPAVVIPVP